MSSDNAPDTLTKSNKQTKRHRWEPIGNHFYSPRQWRCIKCGLQRLTEYDADNEYYHHQGNRTWIRFAPTCPPEEEAQ